MTTNTPLSHQTQLETKRHYILLQKNQGSYSQRNYCTDQFIDNLSLLFDDHKTIITWILDTQLSPTNKGLTGSLSDITINGNTIILQPSSTMADDPEEYATEVNRNELIRLAREWQELVDKKAPLIYIYCQNDKYFVSETLPEGIE